MFYLVDAKKKIVRSAWATVDEAESAAKRMRNPAIVCDAESFGDEFKLDELRDIYQNMTGYKSEGRSKANVVEELVEALDTVDWASTVIQRPTKSRTGACAQVHSIADSMPDATRKEVIEACVAAGINKATASTQYQRWKVGQ